MFSDGRLSLKRKTMPAVSIINPQIIEVVSMETSPFAYWKFFASFDLFSFPRKKYRVNKPSRGTDGLLQATFTPRSHLSMYLKYRYKRKERDWTGSKGTLTLPIFHHQLRYRLNYSLGDVLSSRTTLDYNHFHSQDRAAWSESGLKQSVCSARGFIYSVFFPRKRK